MLIFCRYGLMGTRKGYAPFDFSKSMNNARGYFWAQVYCSEFIVFVKSKPRFLKILRTYAYSADQLSCHSYAFVRNCIPLPSTKWVVPFMHHRQYSEFTGTYTLGPRIFFRWESVLSHSTPNMVHTSLSRGAACQVFQSVNQSGKFVTSCFSPRLRYHIQILRNALRGRGSIILLHP